MSVEKTVNLFRSLWMDTVINDGSKADYKTVFLSDEITQKDYPDLNMMELISEDKVVDRIATGIMPDPETYLFQPIRAAVINKTKLLDSGFMVAHCIRYPSMWKYSERAEVNELSIVGYFAAKKMNDDNVHIFFTLCSPEDYKHFTKEKAMIFLYNRVLVEPQHKIIKNRVVFRQKTYSKFEHKNMEGKQYIYLFPRTLLAQYRYFERRVLNYYKMEH